MRNQVIAGRSAAVMLGLSLGAGAAQAGGWGWGCDWGDCYRPVAYAPVYAQVVTYPPVVMDRVRRVEVVPGAFTVYRAPPVYGSYTRTVMVSPPRHIVERLPSVRTVARVRYCRDGVTRIVNRGVVVPGPTVM